MADHRIQDKDIKATSWITVDQSSSQARLHNIYGEGAWCPRVSDTNQYIEIHLNNLYRITRVATQGRYPLPDCLAGDYWVTQYSLEYTTNTYIWQYYQENNTKKVGGKHLFEWEIITCPNRAIKEKRIKRKKTHP